MIHLIVEGYRSDHPGRDAELQYALKHNLANPLFESVHVFCDDRFAFVDRPSHAVWIKQEARPTVQDLVAYCNSELKGKLCLIANSDIVFDSTLSRVKEYLGEKNVLALSRWEISGVSSQGTEIAPIDSPVSQDCWCFVSPLEVERQLDFTLGTPGVDNRIARVLLDAGLVVRNPACSIVSLHLHHSAHRTNQAAAMVEGPYAGIPITAHPNHYPAPAYISHFNEDGEAELEPPQVEEATRSIIAVENR